MAKEKQTQFKNDMCFMKYYSKYMNIAINRFEWLGLPPDIPEEYLEKTLISQGKLVFVNDSNLNILACEVLENGYLNHYGLPTRITAHGIGYNKEFDVEEVVLCFNNKLKTGIENIIINECQRLADIDRTIDINIGGQKSPYIVKGDDKTILTLKNAYNQISTNQPVLFVDKSINLGEVMVFPTLSPFVADKLLDAKKTIECELLTFLGINNANTDKKERLITDEVQANDEEIENNLVTMLSERKKCASELNAKFGLNITVRVRGHEENDNLDDKADSGTEDKPI